MLSGITYQTMLVTGFIAGIVAGVVSLPVSSALGTDRTSLLIVDLHLEECIKQLQLGNAEEALGHCQTADQALNALLANMTSEN
jgi:hypothetical protein